MPDLLGWLVIDPEYLPWVHAGREALPQIRKG
jgi:hypothetical protein